MLLAPLFKKSLRRLPCPLRLLWANRYRDFIFYLALVWSMICFPEIRMLWAIAGFHGGGCDGSFTLLGSTRIAGNLIGIFFFSPQCSRQRT